MIKCLIPFSGGIDSTAVLYSLLTKYPDDIFLVLRINLINPRSANRNVMERQASINILNKLQQLGINNFCFHEITYDYSTFKYPPIRDYDVICFAISTCLKAYPSINEVVKGVIKDDCIKESFTKLSLSIKESLYRFSGRSFQNLKISFPIKNLTKREVMNTLPESILSLTWSCRFPIPSSEPNNFEMQRCNNCETCKSIDKILLTKQHLDRKRKGIR